MSAPVPATTVIGTTPTDVEIATSLATVASLVIVVGATATDVETAVPDVMAASKPASTVGTSATELDVASVGVTVA